jgi:septal ring factor EnvC (AmiA/AmiB activator)
VQRAYRARLRQAGKVERVVDAAVFEAIQSRAAAPARPDFDPETQFICERAVFRQLRDDLERAATKLKLREEDVARIEKRNAYLEAELKRVEQHNGAILKELIALRQEREQEQKAPKRRARDPLRR